MYSVVSNLSLKYFTERNVKLTSNPNHVLFLQNNNLNHSYTMFIRVQSNCWLQVYFFLPTCTLYFVLATIWPCIGQI